MFNPAPPGPEEQAVHTGPAPMSEEGFLRAFAYAANERDAGTQTEAIERTLQASGLDRQAARAVIERVGKVSEDNLHTANWTAAARYLAQLATLRGKARTNIAIGGLFFIIGLVVTVGSYFAAMSSRVGGTYIIAWGAVVFGAYRAILGFSQLEKLK